MAAQVYRFDAPDRFIAGTVGRPGERSFFLQVRDSTRLISVLLEKEQVSVLAERLDTMLDEVLRRSEGGVDVPAESPEEVDDLDPLEQPIVEEFRVGAMTLSWDGDDERVVVAAYAAGEEETEPPDDPEDSDRDVVVVRLTGEDARAFVKRAQALVAAGRPPCPLCSLPLDADGHICPRQNGYRRRS
ncbi:putative repeat protein (TIGR03847 family) [Haloactinopolyspora alba]|uniref:Putative repeat protein (TIGR03847 family) n=1 Tax=Haloactinopolyspora alba TaxID=648780 RepID=A0A2P8D9B7_9ACTN|nr:DUF3090 domain-containing protein [Haloactinopolyspora alba]PSK93816.1 putative repeat protein (TIGR03847 family) [Haloactinopolyspora alba]